MRGRSRLLLLAFLVVPIELALRLLKVADVQALLGLFFVECYDRQFILWQTHQLDVNKSCYCHLCFHAGSSNLLREACMNYDRKIHPLES